MVQSQFCQELPMLPWTLTPDHEAMTYSGPVMDSQPPRESAMHRSVRVAKAGASFGSALAIAISWSVHKSIVWAIIHGFLSWLYVGYYALTR